MIARRRLGDKPAPRYFRLSALRDMLYCGNKTSFCASPMREGSLRALLITGMRQKQRCRPVAQYAICYPTERPAPDASLATSCHEYQIAFAILRRFDDCGRRALATADEHTDVALTVVEMIQ